jgi:glycosidase
MRPNGAAYARSRGRIRDDRSISLPVRSVHSAFVWGLALVAALAPSCGGGAEPPSRECSTLIWARSETGAAPEVEGSWDDWASRRPLEAYRDGWYVHAASLAPGEYGYRILERGEPRLDPFNPLTTFRDDDEVSLALAPDCAAPELRIEAVEVAGGDVTVRGRFLALPGGSALDPDTLRANDGGGASPPSRSSADPDSGSFTWTARGLAKGKHMLTFEATDEDGRAARPASAVAWVEPAMASWEQGLLYQVMIDRFRGDGGAALSPPATPGSRAGGTLDGVRAEIERGTFEALGVTALWLSPVYRNPVEVRENRDGHLAEGYHGYWPEDARAVDDRLGGEAALRGVIDAAHRRGLRVIFDLVPNHVYEASSRYVEHRNDGWFNEGPDGCVCGSPGCDWGSHLQTCWFTSYLPDIRWQHPAAMRTGAEDARFWMDAFDADGVRIDAVPMMPRATTRRLAAELRNTAAPVGDRALLTLGEVFTGPGLTGIDTIRYFLGPQGIDGAFDFPLMWSIRDAIASGRGGFTEVESTLKRTEAALHGSGSVLGRMIDNHDTARFISEASGEAAADPWARPPPQPTDPAAYARTRMALALLLTLPGLPVLYYGDEVALAGAGDPDCRRVMPAPDALSDAQREVLALTRRLGPLRRCVPALSSGERIPVVVGDEIYAFRRDAGDGSPVLALFSTAAERTEIPLPAGAVPGGAYLDVISGEAVEITEGASVALDPMSFRILLSASSPCDESTGALP